MIRKIGSESGKAHETFSYSSLQTNPGVDSWNFRLLPHLDGLSTGNEEGNSDLVKKCPKRLGSPGRQQKDKYLLQGVLESFFLLNYVFFSKLAITFFTNIFQNIFSVLNDSIILTFYLPIYLLL